MHEQRAADAPVAASDGEPGIAGPEASVLGLPRVSRGEAAPSLPVRTAWAEATQLSVLGSARDAANTTGRGLTSKSVKFQVGVHAPMLLPRCVAVRTAACRICRRSLNP